jgi:REP element-mobilizing transposase RayT
MPSWNWGDTFLNDRHPDLKADFILANPPFNISDWSGEQLREDARWKYGIPPVGNANYAWLQHFIHKLAPNGTAGIVLANGSMNSNTGGEGEIRKNLIEAGLVDCMVALPAQLFYNTMIPACLWFLARNRSGLVGVGLRPAPTVAEMQLNQFGEIVRNEWFDLPKHYPHIQLGSFCIMPNHVHAVIIIVDTIVGAGLRPAPTSPAPTSPAPTSPAPTSTKPLSEIVRAFKSFSARRINEIRKTPGIPVWQRNYYEHIIRNDEEHNRINLYIEANPAKWQEDKDNPGMKP